jgi:atypical dual specificity phosphatase
MPLSGYDVQILKKLGVTKVLNMCKEYNGLTEEYSCNSIEQLCCPTPDAFEPTYVDVVRAVDEIRLCVDMDASVKIFVHCKAGRGRSTCVVFCYLLSLGYSLDEAMAVINHHRSVVDNNVKEYSVVQTFIKDLASLDNDFQRLRRNVLS